MSDVANASSAAIDPLTPAAENSAETAVSPVTGRPFAPGQSGNPGGRPKVESEIRELAQTHSRAAIERLVVLMKSRNQRVAIAACRELLDRGLGKPAIAITGQDGAPFALMPPIINIGFGNGGPGSAP